MKKERTIPEAAAYERMKVGFNGVCVAAAGIFVLRFLGGVLLRRPAFSDPVAGVAAERIFDALSVLLPFLIYRFARKQPLIPLLRAPVQSSHPILRGLLGVIAVLGLTFACLALSAGGIYLMEGHGLHVADPLPFPGATPAAQAVYVILSVLLCGPAYEVAFRGIALEGVREENAACAVLLSACCFALTDPSLYLMPCRLVAGLLLGCLYLRTRSLFLVVWVQGLCQGLLALFFVFFEPSALVFAGVAGALLGIPAAILLFFPRRPLPSGAHSTAQGIRCFLTSFGIWILLLITSFSLLMGTFSTDADPNDPLFEPTPTEHSTAPPWVDK